jgi:uncharacterized damage-inducible protein DinB
MSEVERIARELRRASERQPWYGPSVRTLLEGVDVRTATARPIEGAHTICELVLHMTAWTREVMRRLRDNEARDPEDGDWPAMSVASEEEWREVRARFDRANAELVDAIRALDDASLSGTIGDARDGALGGGVPRYVTLHGIVQHHVYHAGQIALLKKAFPAQ